MALNFPGNTSFAQSGPARWIRDGWGLDKLIVPYSGAVTGLDTFRNALVHWQPSTIDSHMYLSDWTSDDNKQFPTVELTFIGKKGGILPAVSKSIGETLQTATATDGQLQLEVLYRSPHTSFKWVGNTPARTHDGYDPAAGVPTILVRRINGAVPEFVDVSKLLLQASFAGATEEQLAALNSQLAAWQPLIDSLKSRLVAYFNLEFTTQTLLTSFTATPLVPDRYWECESVTSSTFVSRASV